MNRRKFFKRVTMASVGGILLPSIPVEELIPVVTSSPISRLGAGAIIAPNLQRGVIKVLMERGARPLMESLSFKTIEGGVGFKFCTCNPIIPQLCICD